MEKVKETKKKLKKIICIVISIIILIIFSIWGIIEYKNLYTIKGHILSPYPMTLTRNCVWLNLNGNTTKDDTVISYQENQRDNVFGITKKNPAKPGSTYTVELELENKSNRLMGYWAEVQILHSENENIEEFVKVSGVVGSSEMSSQSLSLGSELLTIGDLGVGAKQVFTITVTYDSDGSSNENIIFDLLIHAQSKY